MQHSSRVILALAVTFLIGCGVARLGVAFRDANRRDLPIDIIRRWNDPGLCKLVWAGGPVIVSGDERTITTLDSNGRVKAMLRTDWLIDPDSVQSEKAVVLGQFSEPYKPSRPETLGTFPGLLDLKTGEHRKLAYGDRLWFPFNGYAYRARFWSSDYKMFLGVPRRKGGTLTQAEYERHVRQLTLLCSTPPRVSLWTSPNWGFPISWWWSDLSGRKGFWILTTHPGELYPLNGAGRSAVRIPALDANSLAVLSPRLDRAIVLRTQRPSPAPLGACLVDFSNLGSRVPISIRGHKSGGQMTVGWGAWSPDGKQVALLLADQTGGKPLDLYLGDPTQVLAKVDRKGLRFSGGCLPREFDDTAGVGTLVWSADSKYVVLQDG